MGPLTLVRWLLQRAFKSESPCGPGSKLKKARLSYTRFWPTILYQYYTEGNNYYTIQYLYQYYTNFYEGLFMRKRFMKVSRKIEGCFEGVLRVS